MRTWLVALALAAMAWPCPGRAEDVFQGPPLVNRTFSETGEGPALTTSGQFPPIRPQPGTAPCDRLIESTWYTRVDYFRWNERLAGRDFVNEDGPFVTLGYVRRVGIERFRVELFGGDVNYSASIEFDDGSSEPLSSTTGYLGVRGEYDLLLEPEWWPRATFFVGIGTRLWVRDLKDEVLSTGEPVVGYEETWWTIYPYLGLETRRVQSEGTELYGSARIGCTPLTYEHATLFDVSLHPRTGITGQLECGLRGRRLHLAGFFEAMTWTQSGVVREVLQPESRMFTVGLKTGFSF